ncbi:YbaB/EbfC family nucleoid-associated protein [Spirillospora sp. NBC_00431]
MTLPHGPAVDLRKFRDDLRKIRDRADGSEATAESDDGLVRVRVGGRGRRLLDLDLDPRVFRDPDSRALAETITATLGRARDRAAEDLAALAREVFAAPPPADRAPGPDPLPSEDRELTTSMLRLQEELAEVAAEAESPDALIGAAVDRRGDLTHLRLDPRVFRGTDPGALSEAITRTLDEAGEDVQKQLFELLEPYLPPGARRDDVDLGLDPLIHQLDRRLERTRRRV